MRDVANALLSAVIMTVSDLVVSLSKTARYAQRSFAVSGPTKGAALPETKEASAELNTANGGMFTSFSGRLSSQLRYRSLVNGRYGI